MKCQDRLYIAMEYIAPNEEGLNSLEGYLQRRPPDLAQSLRWAIQVCHGMEYAYSKGVRAHRDLKPANIMISQDMTAKITDFGLAGEISESPAKLTARFGWSAGENRAPGQTRLELDLAPLPTWLRSNSITLPGVMSAVTSTALGSCSTRWRRVGGYRSLSLLGRIHWQGCGNNTISHLCHC